MAVLVGPQGPRGDRGLQGPVGPRGFDGKRGPNGKNGKDGATGPKGDRGDRGFPGNDGKQGIQGLRGKDGSPGKDGSISGIEHTLNPTDVASDSTPGAGLTAAARDHTHKGVRSIRADAQPQLFSDVVLASGPGISMSQVGNTITLSSSGSGSPLTFTQGLVNILGTVHNTFFTGAGTDQTLYGGADATGSLHLSSTSNATKGKIYFGVGTSGMQYDEPTDALYLPSLNAGGILKTDVTTGLVDLAISGTDYQPPGAYLTALTGDVTAAGPGSVAAAFRAFAATSVLANATGTSATPSDLASTTSGDVLWNDGGALTWGAIPESSVTNLTTDLAALTPMSRVINTTAPLTGGGALTADLTLAIDVFGASGPSHSTGAVPDPGSSAGTTRFLREDATWQTVSATGDHKLSIDGSDATYDFLAAKLTATLPLLLTVVGGAAPPPPSSGLALWLKADAGVTLSGSDVTNWADQSGNGNDVAATGTPPVFNSSSINSLPGITFNASTPTPLENSISSVLTAGSDRHIIVVSKPSNPQGGTLICFRFTSLDSTWDVLTLGGAQYFWSDGSDLANTSAAVDYTATPIAVEFTGQVGSPPTVDINTTSITLTTANNVTTESGTTGFAIGERPSSPGQGWFGDICEVLVYDHVLSSPDLATVRTYLQARYNINLGHPGSGGSETLNATVQYDNTSIGLVANQFALIGIPDATPLAGDLIFPAYSTPATPPAGFTYVWSDGLNGNLWIMNELAVSSHTAQTTSSPTHEFFNGLNDDGSFSSAQPDFADLTGQATYAQIQDESANTLLGNPGGSLTTPSEITLGAGLSFSGTTLVNTVTGGITQLTGDVTAGPGSGSQVATIGANKVTYSQIQQVGAASLLGNPTGGSADASEITLGAGLAFSGSTLVSTVSPTSDHKLSIDGSDTTYDFLAAKLTADAPITLTVTGSAPTPPTSGLALWLKADAGVTLSGSDVTAWADQSGNGNDVTAPGTPPTFDASVINGLPGVRFTGAAVSLANTSTSLITAGAARHVFSVVKCGSTASPGGPIVVFRGNTPWFAAYLAIIGGNTYAYSDGATTASTLTSPPTLTSTAFEVEHASAGTGTGNLTLALDGTNQTLATPDIATESGATGFVIGNAPTASQYFDGDVCEVFVYDHVLTGSDLADLRGYLQARYGITIAGAAGGGGSETLVAALTIDSTLAVVSSTLGRAAISGDVSISAGSNTSAIGAHKVTYGQMQQASASALLGNPTGSTDDVSEITLGAGLAFTGTTLVNTSPLSDLSVSDPIALSGTALSLNLDSTLAVVSSNLGRAAITGDVTISAGSNTAALVNIPNDTTMAGDLLATAMAAPTHPATGFGRVYFDSTAKNLWSINEFGTKSHTAQSVTASGHLYLTGLNDDGGFTRAQPAYTDLQNITASTLLGNPTGGSAAPSLITLGAGLSFSGTTLVATGTTGTTGSVPFYGAGGSLTQDNANLFWDDSNHYLGIGLNTPADPLDILFTLNGPSGFHVKNASSGSSAQIQNRLENSAGDFAYYGISSTAFTGFGPLNGGAAFFGSYNVPTSIFTQTAQDIVIYTNATEQMRIASGGAVTLKSLAAGGIPIAAATTGQLGLDSTFTFDTSTKALIAGYALVVNQDLTGLATNVMVLCDPAHNSDRDRLQFYVGGGTIIDSPDNTYFAINPLTTALTTAYAGIFSTARIEAATYSGPGFAAVGEATSLYIDGAPTLSGFTSTTYALHVGAGATRLGGSLQVDSTVKLAALTGPGVLQVDGSGNVSVASRGLCRNVSYYVSGINPISPNFGYLLTSSPSTVTSGATLYPLGVAATSVRLYVNVLANTIPSGGLLHWDIYMNGTLQATVSALSNVSAGTLIDTGLDTLLGTTATTDCWGVYVHGTGTATGSISFTAELLVGY